jgi:outer membrane receptor protein involved in Fe transport
LCFIFTLAFGAEQAKSSFDLPADTADKSLRLFSTQSGLEVLFVTDVAAGVRTNAVKGEFTSMEAAGRLLSGTSLTIVRDDKNGVLRVVRAAKEEPAAAPKKNALPATVQTPPVLAKEEIVELSPFIVTSSGDVGYVAANSLSGSRLNTPLKDSAASISVLTSEFLGDVGAIDLKEAAQYTPNLQNELSEEGAQGNRLVEFFSQYRIRGTRASVTRNYFTWDLPSDTYNIDRIDQSRGPNSILFGVGFAGGIVNSTTKQPLTARRFATVSLTGGSHDARRTTLDVNQPLLGGRAALRFNAVMANRETFRFFEFNRTEAAHLSGLWQVFKHTTLRAEGERGFIKDNVARAWTLVDLVSTWNAAGRPTFAAPVAANATQGIARFSTTAARVTLIDNTGQLLDLRGRNLTTVAVPNNNNAITDRTIADDSINPNGPGAIRTNDYSTYSVALEQQLGEKTFVELAYNHQEYEFLGFDPDTVAHQFFGDPNQNLPTGAANPFVGKYYLDTNWFRRTRAEEHKDLRLTASTSFDLRKFGAYRFAVMAEQVLNQFKKTEKREFWAGAPFGGTPESAANLVFRRSYVTTGDWSTYRHGGGKGQLISNLLDPVSGRTLSSYWINRSGNADDDPSRLRSVLAAVEARYFEGRLVGTVGLRRDWLHNENRGNGFRDPATNIFVQDYTPANVDVTDFTYNTHTYGLVAHPAPWLSLHYNKSNNSALPNVSHRVLPGGARPPGGKGKGDDYGFTLSFLEGKAYFKATRYTTAVNQDSDFRTSTTVTGHDRILDTLLANGLITPADFTAHDSLVGTANAVLFDRAGNGYEFELVANPTPQWRLSANFTRSEMIEDHVADELVAWAASQIPYWQGFNQSLVLGNGNTIAQEIVVLNTDLATLTATNGIASLGNRRDKFNLTTRYTFGSGALRRLYVGGGARYASGAVGGRSVTKEVLYGNQLRQFDVFAGYPFKFRGFACNVQLNVYNLFDFTDPQTTNMTPQGVVSRYSLLAPRTFRVSTRIEF